ncbi:MAG: PfkB family carbohydrate kinase [Saprospiraceae bacterium]
MLLAGKHIRHILSNTFSMITLSEKGVFYDEENQSGIIPTIPRSIADVSGAGDTVISVTTLGLACNLDIRTIAILSNLAGGQVCEKVGVVPVDKKLPLEGSLGAIGSKA